MDADGLNILAMLSQRCDGTLVCDNQRVITPHPGEAARLLNVTTQQVESDRYSAARQLQERYGGVVVLKGAGTLVLMVSECMCASQVIRAWRRAEWVTYFLV